jgi:hypothetical protein
MSTPTPLYATARKAQITFHYALRSRLYHCIRMHGTIISRKRLGQFETTECHCLGHNKPTMANKKKQRPLQQQHSYILPREVSIPEQRGIERVIQQRGIEQLATDPKIVVIKSNAIIQQKRKQRIARKSPCKIATARFLPSKIAIRHHDRVDPLRAATRLGEDDPNRVRTRERERERERERSRSKRRIFMTRGGDGRVAYRW